MMKKINDKHRKLPHQREKNGHVSKQTECAYYQERFPLVQRVHVDLNNHAC